MILTTGTFINGRLVVGDKTQPGGRAGEGPALGISDSLRSLGLSVRRFKTGTPPRIDARSIDFSKTEPQPGSRAPLYFSRDTRARADVQLPGNRPNPYRRRTGFVWLATITFCELCAHDRTDAPDYSQQPTVRRDTALSRGMGPRYCPSIEDKIVRFADKSFAPDFPWSRRLAHGRESSTKA